MYPALDSLALLFWRPSPATYCTRHTHTHTPQLEAHATQDTCGSCCMCFGVQRSVGSTRWQVPDIWADTTPVRISSTPSDKSVNSRLAPLLSGCQQVGFMCQRSDALYMYVWMQRSGYSGQSSGMGFLIRAVNLRGLLCRHVSGLIMHPRKCICQWSVFWE